MELVEGPTLAERLAAGSLSLDDSLSIARQMALGLEEAHAKGIIHRDLKPQNVKAADRGDCQSSRLRSRKVHDPAGVASTSDLSLSPAMMNSPTMTVMPGTQLGIILGTAAYMSPEQARGSTVDKRADVWALGVVLFEMLSGRPLFADETVTDTLSAVLKSGDRLQRAPGADSSRDTSAPPPLPRTQPEEPDSRHGRRPHRSRRCDRGPYLARRRRRRKRLDNPPPSMENRGLGIALVLAGAAAGIGVFARRPVTKPAEPLRFSVMLAAGQEILNGANGILTFAPDGRSLVFAGTMNGKQHLFRRGSGRARGRGDSGGEPRSRDQLARARHPLTPHEWSRYPSSIPSGPATGESSSTSSTGRRLRCTGLR